VSRQIDGWRHAPLGLLWRPKYFNGGIAVHGANSVPPYPASHGCARVSIAAMNWLWTNDKIPIDTRVWVY
jgi:lipoprotein-anchoring transpeptidase ErfK/SrfK